MAKLFVLANYRPHADPVTRPTADTGLQLDRPRARFYFHERGRVLSAGAPPQIMAADQIKSRILYLLDKIDMATDFRDGDLSYDMAEQMLHLLEARRDAARWLDAHGLPS